jgi:hypothetical protein
MNKSIIRYLILMFCLAVVVTASMAGNATDIKKSSSTELIRQAFLAGKIGEGEKVFRDVQAVLAPDELPVEYKAATKEIIKCGTSIIHETLDKWSLMSADQQAKASSYLTRPVLDYTYISPDSKFMIHYAISGYDAVPSADLNSNSIPDYVERIGIYADSSYREYNVNQGYLPFINDGDGYYDIYILNIGAYGVTIRDIAGDSSWNDYGSYIQVHCTFAGFPSNEDPEGSVIGAQKVTCAHELFHAEQLLYDGNEDLWWMECSATNAEEVVFPEVNDNYNYLPNFFNYPDTFLTITDYHMYSTFIWATFLEKKYGRSITRSIWEKCRYYNSLPATDSALAIYGKKIENIFPEFTVWNYFTGERGIVSYYDSGAAYPIVPFDRIINKCPFTAVISNYPPDGLGGNYIMAYPNATDSGVLRLDFDGSDAVTWGFSYIAFKGTAAPKVVQCNLDVNGRTLNGIYDFSIYDSIAFIPCIVSPWLNNNQYQFGSTVLPFGDPDGSGKINLLDGSYLITFLYRGGPPPKYDYHTADMDCNGKINLLDMNYLIKFLYRGGPAPGPYRP